MSHCHDEHSHDHGHGDHDHNHDHSDDITPALQHSLYEYVVFDNIVTLNESVDGSGKAVVKKTWAERMTELPELLSDADDQMLMTVPFTGQVKLHSILIRTSPADSAPRTLKVFINRDDLDFAAAEESRPTQVFDLSRTSEVQELPVRRADFARCQRLVLFFADAFGAERAHLSYLGFRGEWTRLGRAPVSILYEAAPNPSDHAVKGVDVHGVGSAVGGSGMGRDGM